MRFFGKFLKKSEGKKLQNNIREASIYIKRKRGFFGPTLEKLVAEFIDLKINSQEEIWPLLLDLLDEIKPEHQITTSPSSKIQGCEVYVFVWASKKLRREMFLKYAIKNKAFYYLSLRPN